MEEALAMVAGCNRADLGAHQHMGPALYHDNVNQYSKADHNPKLYKWNCTSIEYHPAQLQHHLAQQQNDHRPYLHNDK
jgi:hypothetical protein